MPRPTRFLRLEGKQMNDGSRLHPSDSEKNTFDGDDTTADPSAPIFYCRLLMMNLDAMQQHAHVDVHQTKIESTTKYFRMFQLSECPAPLGSSMKDQTPRSVE